MQLPLLISTGGQNWSYFAIRSNDPKFKEFEQKVFDRDNYKCRYCSFKARNQMQVVNIDGNYLNNELTNLATACIFCMQCFFIEMIGKVENTGATAIYMPEITQNELNGLCHSLFCALALHAKSYQTAESIYNALKLRSEPIEKQWGKGLSSPDFLGQMLLDTPNKNQEFVKKEILSQIRILPDYDKFSNQIRSWAYASNNIGF